MKRMTVVVALAFSICAASTAYAQPGWDTYVAATGNDTNLCSLSFPCATYTRAFAETAAGGIIHAVNAGAYGSLLITHSITIDGGGISSPLGGGGTNYEAFLNAQFYIDAGATDVVTIENMIMGGNHGSHSEGIHVNTVGTLHVQNCLLIGYHDFGINFHATGAELQLKDVTITDMPAGTGVYVSNARASLDHVAIHSTQAGVISAGSSAVSITHSTANGNAEAFAAGYGPTAEIHVDDCLMTNNEWAVVVANGAKAYVGRSSLFNNTISALFNDGSSFLYSFGTNQLIGNAVDGLFTATVSLK
jgi:hypothetical protein